MLMIFHSSAVLKNLQGWREVVSVDTAQNISEMSRVYLSIKTGGQ